MPLRKYRSVEEMEDTFWIAPGTPSHQRAVRIVMASVSFLPPGDVFHKALSNFDPLSKSASGASNGKENSAFRRKRSLPFQGFKPVRDNIDLCLDIALRALDDEETLAVRRDIVRNARRVDEIGFERELRRIPA